MSQFFHLLNDAKITLQERWKALMTDQKCAELLAGGCRVLWLIMQTQVTTGITKGAVVPSQSSAGTFQGMTFTFVLWRKTWCSLSSGVSFVLCSTTSLQN